MQKIMNKQEKNILKVRERYMHFRKILCTGNPDKKTCIAYGIKQIWPNATFMHLSNGYNFLNFNTDLEYKLKNLFLSHNTFINASYISDNVQKRLLEICCENMKIGDVFNIGSMYEYDGSIDTLYKLSKIKLKTKSIELNSFRFQTCHIVLGGIDKNDKKTKNWIKPIAVAKLISSLMKKKKFKIPIIAMDQPKKPH